MNVFPMIASVKLEVFRMNFHTSILLRTENQEQRTECPQILAADFRR